MSDNLRVEELRLSLLARRDALRSELQQVEDALEDFDRVIETARKAAGVAAPKPKAKATHAPKLRAPRRSKRQKPKFDISAAVMSLVDAQGDVDTFDAVSITREATEKGIAVDQKQVSTVLRRALEGKKIKQIEPGGPRKPAIYASLGFAA